MPLILHPATPADLPSLVRIQFAAFHPTDMMHVMLYPSPVPPTEEVYERTVEKLRREWEENRRELEEGGGEGMELVWVKVVDEEKGAPGGEIVGGAKFLIFPHANASRWADPVPATWIRDEDKGKGNFGRGVEDRGFVEWMMEEMWWRRRERARGACVLLEILFTHPSHHRRGVGKQLITYGTERADAVGVKTIVGEASLPGKRLYEGNGFVMREEVRLDGGKVKEEWESYEVDEYIWFEREPRGSG